MQKVRAVLDQRQVKRQRLSGVEEGMHTRLDGAPQRDPRVEHESRP